MNQKYEQQMKKGVLEILVLKLLSEDEKYGYQLINELKERSQNMFLLKEGTLYPILYRLEEEDLVTFHWSQPKEKEVSKKFYTITPKGIESLKEAKDLWSRFSLQVNNILLDGKDD